MTLKETLDRSAQKHGDKVLMKYKRNGDWQTLSFRQFLTQVRNIAEGLARACHVRPGDRVATDGVIADGRSSLDTSAVTGESIPVDVAPGDAVPAGSINGAGALRVRATAAAL